MKPETFAKERLEHAFEICYISKDISTMAALHRVITGIAGGNFADVTKEDLNIALDVLNATVNIKVTDMDSFGIDAKLEAIRDLSQWAEAIEALRSIRDKKVAMQNDE